MGTLKYLSSDHDPLFTYHQWAANLRILDVDEVKSIPYTPCPHPFIERLIGTVRRDYLDQTLFWNAVDLERKLMNYQTNYNKHRTHRSLGGETPAEVAGVVTKLPIKLINSVGRHTAEGFISSLLQLEQEFATHRGKPGYRQGPS